MKEVYWVIEGQLAGRTGPVLAPWNLAELREAGLRVIVSLSELEDPEAMVEAGLRPYLFPIPPVLDLTEEDTEVLLQGVRAALPVIKGEVDAGRPVLVHCYAGRDRTGVVLASYLVRHAGLSAVEAVQRVRQLRPDAMSARGYEEAVARFEERERALGR